MNTALISVPANEHHWAGHPENPDRIWSIMKVLEERNILTSLELLSPEPATTTQLLAVHQPQLVQLVGFACSQGGGYLDADTYTTESSFIQARLAAGATCQLVDGVITGEIDNGFALVRPPGHHAGIEQVGGFCLFNNVAIAARHAQMSGGLERVMIIDFDIHHGNGTQDIFYQDPSVLYASLHLYSPFFYPGSGGENEIGIGKGLGTTLNVPFGPKAGDKSYDLAFKDLILPRGKQFNPELILVSAGFDGHWLDPLASANLSLAGFVNIIRHIFHLANETCQGRVIFVLEGGYHREALAYGVLNTLYALIGQDVLVDPMGHSPLVESDFSRLVQRLQLLHLQT